MLKFHQLQLKSFLFLTVPVLSGFLHLLPASAGNEENHAPVVKILSPKTNISYRWGSPVSYSVSVSDQEDGESKFQEIESGEVLLQVRIVTDSTRLSAELLDESRNNPSGLTEIRSSDCLNCHAFQGRLIGPSFAEISKRYPDTAENQQKLVNNVMNGLTGVWGKEVMPSHPQLAKDEAVKMVSWILNNAGDTTVSYFRGTEGSFRINAPQALSGNAHLILSASYQDHGLKDKPGPGLRGQDTVVLNGN